MPQIPLEACAFGPRLGNLLTCTLLTDLSRKNIKVKE